MKSVTSNIIAASAGTGKTYKLASRFISLLALGYAPERLIALTFTRNAAGEFKRKILQALADGAESAAGAESLKQRIISTLSGTDVPLCPDGIREEELTQERFCELLSELVRKLSHLHLCTLDSFFSKLVNTNCLRLGFPEVSLMSEAEEMKMRKAALRAMIDQGSKPENEGALLDLCENISEGSKKTIFSVLEKNVAEFFALYRDTEVSAQNVWGKIDVFGFDDGSVLRELQKNRDSASEKRYIEDLLDKRKEEIEEKAEALRGKYPEKLNGTAVNSCKGVVNKLRSYYRDGIRPADFIGKSLGPCLYGGPTGVRAIDELMHLIRSTRDTVTWMPVVRRTRAILRLMENYGERYDRDVMASGKLVFDNMPRLVAEKLLNDGNPGAVSDIAYRLDGQLDHWMLDEFQDTSPAQWRALKVLLEEIRDEVAQDEEHLCAERSIFVVGDEKQSIYAWRGATPQLFSYLRRGKDGWRALQPSEQYESYRSTEAIMGEEKEVNGVRYGFVNELFEKLFDRFPHLSEGEQREEFFSHSVAKCNEGKPGYVRVESPEAPQESTETVLETMCARMFDILTEELNFKERKITVAILVRSNDDVRSICQRFHSCHPDLPVISMSDEKLSGSSLLGECLLHFFRWLQHPTSTHCLAMAKLSPLHVSDREVSAGKNSDKGESGRLWKRWRGILEAEGYARVVQLLTDGLQAPEGPGSEEMTAHDWLNEARAFDADGGTLDDWLLHIDNLSTKAHPADACIHVMTFHKSKGLGYDAVFLPFNGANAVYSRGVSIFRKVLPYEKDRVEVIGMVLNPGVNDRHVPESPYRKLIEGEREKLMKEALHVLYVAVTRAKRANYILLNPKVNAGSYSKLISDALAMDDASRMREWGVKDWVTDMPVREPVSKKEQMPLIPPVERRRKSVPSKEADSSSDAGSGASPANFEAAQFGTDVHALFEQIEWLDAARLPDWVAHPQSPEECVVAAALNEPSIRALFTRREGLSVYREQGIESIRRQNGADVWVSGTIDRLILTEVDGQVTDAHVIDFKTDIRPDAPPEEQSSQLRERHRAQLNAYCELIARIFPDAVVHATIVSCPRNRAEPTALPL